MDTLQDAVFRLEEKVSVSIRSDANALVLNEVDNRVTKLEMLLLRTSLKDFQSLDQDIISMLPKCAPYQPLRHEPELEQSPKKSVVECEPPFPSDEDRWMTPKCLHYDISDVQATATQTDRPSEHSVVGTQTVIQKKLRKGRCHGRASQTDPIDISITTWELLPLHILQNKIPLMQTAVLTISS